MNATKVPLPGSACRSWKRHLCGILKSFSGVHKVYPSKFMIVFIPVTDLVIVMQINYYYYYYYYYASHPNKKQETCSSIKG